MENITDKKTLGLVLGAGGSRGVAHIGFLQALLEAGIKPDCIAGTSAGSVVGALYGAGISPQKMFTAVMNLKKNDILDPFRSLNGAGLFSTKKILATLRSFLGDKKIKDLNLPFCCVATDLVEGVPKVFDSECEAALAVTASSCIPGFFEPVVIDGTAYVDGSLLERLPIAQIKEFNPDIIVAVDVFDRENSRKEYHNIITVLTRTFDIMDQEKTEAKIKELAPDLLVKPQLAGISQYSFKGMNDAYYEGYASGIASIKEIKRLLGSEV
ncbi:MAG: patatin-like phospholipase family protein [Ruminococcus sp.]